MARELITQAESLKPDGLGRRSLINGALRQVQAAFGLPAWPETADDSADYFVSLIATLGAAEEEQQGLKVETRVSGELIASSAAQSKHWTQVPPAELLERLQILESDFDRGLGSTQET
jgi:hypothetical protein